MVFIIIFIVIVLAFVGPFYWGFYKIGQITIDNPKPSLSERYTRYYEERDRRS